MIVFIVDNIYNLINCFMIRTICKVSDREIIYDKTIMIIMNNKDTWLIYCNSCACVHFG